VPLDRGTALVTGAGRGIGQACARALGQAGFAVALASLEQDPPPLPEDVRRWRYYPFDVSRIETHADLLEAIERDLGPVSCLVNNAGVTSLVRGDMLDLSPESFDRSVAVNLRGTFFLTQAVARRLVGREDLPAGATIITISSANAEIVGDNRADYCMTKAALAMMNKLFATRLAEAGIGVFEIRPGIIETDMTAPARAKYGPYIEQGGVPMRRWGTPDDIAQAVVTLASGGLPYATGLHLDIGGGLQLHRV
jgi:NAD(P)-dependent dehydrogenase (short-subunit alcohol dehydrogenase family)